MTAEKDEKATDLIVAQKLKDAGIAFCPNGSSISEIKKALKSASKRGNGRNGYGAVRGLDDAGNGEMRETGFFDNVYHVDNPTN